MTNTERLAEALRYYEQALLTAFPYGARGQVYESWNRARKALNVHEAAAPAKPAGEAVPGLYVGLIERLMRLSTRLGIANGDSVEHFAASLEDGLYAICRSAESLLDSLAPAAPAPEAQAAGQELPPLPTGWKFNHARQKTDDDGPVDGVWEIGWLEVDDNYFAPIVTVDTGLYYQDKDAEPLAHAVLARLIEARAALAQRQPLTRRQISDIMTEHYPLDSMLSENVDSFEDCVRDIEAAHGIVASGGEVQG